MGGQVRDFNPNEWRFHPIGIRPAFFSGAQASTDNEAQLLTMCLQWKTRRLYLSLECFRRRIYVVQARSRGGPVKGQGGYNKSKRRLRV